MRMFTNTAVMTVNRLVPKFEVSFLRGNFSGKLFDGLSVRTEIDAGRSGAEGSKFRTDITSMSGIVEGDITPWICNRGAGLRVLIYAEVKYRVGIDMFARALGATPSMLKGRLLPGELAVMVDRFIAHYANNVWMTRALWLVRAYPAINLGLTAIDLAMLIAALRGLTPEAPAAPLNHVASNKDVQTMMTKQEAPKEAHDVSDSANSPAFKEAMAQGRRFLQQSEPDYQHAAEQFLKAAKLQVTDAEPLIFAARAAIGQKKTDTALDASDAAVERAPTSSRAWNTKGRAELQRAFYDHAIAAFTTSAKLDRNNIWARNNHGYAEIQRGHYKDALVPLKQATQSKSAPGYMFNNLGVAHMHLGNFKEARDAFDDAVARQSKNAVANLKRLDHMEAIARRTKNRLPIEVTHGGSHKTQVRDEQHDAASIPVARKAPASVREHPSVEQRPHQRVPALSGGPSTTPSVGDHGETPLRDPDATIRVRPSDGDRRDGLPADVANRLWNDEHPRGPSGHVILVTDHPPPHRIHSAPPNAPSATSADHSIVTPSDGDRRDGLSSDEANRLWDLDHPKKNRK
jgi:Flp pilus assembly protein TadD